MVPEEYEHLAGEDRCHSVCDLSEDAEVNGACNASKDFIVLEGKDDSRDKPVDDLQADCDPIYLSVYLIVLNVS